MRFITVAALMLPALAAASSWKDTMADQFDQVKDQVRFPDFSNQLKGKNDPCPDLVVRCLKDGDITKVVGDIGKQSFCRDGVTCKQCHETKNTAQCNAKYPIDCATKCTAQGSPI